MNFSGFEDYDTCRPCSLRVLLCLLSCGGVVGAGVIAIEVSRWAEENKTWNEMIDPLNVPAPCVTTGEASKGLERQPDPPECDGRPCPDMYRSWVGVSLDGVKPNKAVISRCYSHITLSYEQGSEVPLDFLKRYGPTPGSNETRTFQCCYDPKSVEGLAVRFCDWDEREPEFAGPGLIISIVVVCVALVYAAAFFVCRRYDLFCCNEDHTPPDNDRQHVELEEFDPAGDSE